MEDIILRTIGLAILVFISFDAFLTVLTIKGSGPVTRYLSQAAWFAFRSLHERRTIHNLLSMVGPMLIVVIIMIWYFSAALGWFLIYASETTSVVNNTTGETVSWLDKLYFTGVTVGNLGYGDLVPSVFPWTLLAFISTFMCTFIISTAVSYIIPVVSAAVSQQHLARAINSLGDTPEEIYELAFHSDDADAVKSHLAALSSQYENLGRQYLSYPILGYFHTRDPYSAISVQSLKLVRAMLRRHQEVSRPGVEKIVLSALIAFNEQTHGQTKSQVHANSFKEMNPADLVDDFENLSRYDGWPEEKRVEAGYQE